MSAGRNLNRAAKLVYSFHFCPHCHKNYLVYWLFFCCQLFFSDKQSSKRFTCTHNPIFQPCHLCHFHFRLPRHFGNVWWCGFCCRACSLCYSLPSPLKFVSAPYFSSSTHTSSQFWNWNIHGAATDFIKSRLLYFVLKNRKDAHSRRFVKFPIFS